MFRRPPLTSISGNKTPRKELSLLTKGEISGQAKLGLTPTQIARSLDVPPSTVRSVLGRLQTTPSGANKSRSGRPLSITPRAARILLRQLRSEPKITWRQLKTNTGIDLDARTLNATLRAHGISHWLALRRPKLTPEVALLRLKWAEKHVDWTVDQWGQVIWSDEASVTRGTGKAREWVFGTPDQKWDRNKVTEMPNGKPFSIMVWGAF
jgi:transposase